MRLLGALLLCVCAARGEEAGGWGRTSSAGVFGKGRRHAAETELLASVERRVAPREAFWHHEGAAPAAEATWALHAPEDSKAPRPASSDFLVPRSEFSRGRRVGFFERNGDKLQGLGLATAFGLFAYNLVKIEKALLDEALKALASSEANAPKEIATGLTRVQGRELELSEEERALMAALVDVGALDTSFRDIGGLEEQKATLEELVVFPMRQARMVGRAKAESEDGAGPTPPAHPAQNPWTGHPLLRPPTGILLHGPPGCGKTMLIRAAAREAGVNLLLVTPGLIESKWFGEAPRNLRALFSLARKIQPCLIYMDEVDSLCMTRQQEAVSRDMKSELLQQWDGLQGVKGDRIIILGSTNALMDLDPAFQRRFARSIHVPYPTFAQRVKVLEKLLLGITLDPTVDVADIATMTEHYSCSDLEELGRMALHRAVREMRARSQQRSPGSAAASEGPTPVPSLRPLTLADFQAAAQEALPTRFFQEPLTQTEREDDFGTEDGFETEAEDEDEDDDFEAEGEVELVAVPGEKEEFDIEDAFGDEFGDDVMWSYTFADDLEDDFDFEDEN